MSSLVRLCAYWFVMTAALGIYFPYFSLYLTESLGFSGAQAGLAFSVPPLIGIFAQPLWGQIADRTGSRTTVLTWLSAGTAVGYALLTLPHSVPAMLGVLAVSSLFTTTQVSMAVAVSLVMIEREGGRINFGRVRVWGTLGFFGIVVGVPPVLRLLAAQLHKPEREIFHALFLLAALFAGVAALLASGLPRTPAPSHARAQPGDQRWLLGHRPYLRVLLVNFAAYAFLHGPMVLFPVYVRSRGGSAATISYMWIFMLGMETLLMFSMSGLIRRLGAQGLITLGILACGVRWTVSGFCRELSWVYPLQMTHGMLVLALQVGAPLLVESLVPERLRATSQAGLNVVGSGVGGMLSSALAGLVLDAYGIDTVMWLAGGAGLALGLLVPWLLPRSASGLGGSGAHLARPSGAPAMRLPQRD